MNAKRWVIKVILTGIVLVLLSWQLPAFLKALPSRYVARLPESLQQLGERGDGVAILPTVAAPASDELVLLTNLIPATATAVPEPATLTPIPLTNAVLEPSPVPTITPTRTPMPEPLPPAVRLEGIQHIFQSWNNCGPATTAMALSYFRLYVNQADTATYLKPNPEDRNVSPYEISRYVNEQTPYQAIDRANGSLNTIKRLLAADIPVVIEVGIEPPGEYRWLGWYGHYLLVVAYDDDKEQFWVYDSWFGTSDTPMENADRNGRPLTYAQTDAMWAQFNRNYVAFYRPEQQNTVEKIIGENMSDEEMWAQALGRNQLALQQAPEDAFLWFNLGTIYNALGDYERGAASFDQARAIGLPWRMLWYQFGPYEAYYQTGRYEDILLLAEVTLKDRPYFEESFYYQGLALEAIGDSAAARRSMQQAVEFNPYFQPATEALQRLAESN